MGVRFDRILDEFSGPFEALTDFARVPAGRITGAPTPAGYYFTHQANDSFVVVNRLVAAGEDVSWLQDGPMGRGTFYVAAKPSTRAILQKAATELGISFEAAAAEPAGGTHLRKPRIGLFDTYGSSNMPSGWTRLILESFEFPYERVFPPDLDKGGLHDKYDVLVFNGAGLQTSGVGGRAGRGGAPAEGGGRAGFNAAPIPEEFARRQGQVTAQTLAQIKQFVQEGGTVIAIGASAMGAVEQFALPITNHLVENDVPLPREKYYVPGAVLRLSVDDSNPLAHGLGKELDVFFDNDPVFTLAPDNTGSGPRRVGWFNGTTPLRSGWAWGQQYLDKGVEIVETNFGKGRLFLMAPEVLFRSQPHGCYKLFFNGLYLSVAPGMTSK
jgi:hypothetical protein